MKKYPEPRTDNKTPPNYKGKKLHKERNPPSPLKGDKTITEDNATVEEHLITFAKNPLSAGVPLPLIRYPLGNTCTG